MRAYKDNSSKSLHDGVLSFAPMNLETYEQCVNALISKIFACQVGAIPASTLLSKKGKFQNTAVCDLGRPKQNLQTSL